MNKLLQVLLLGILALSNVPAAIGQTINAAMRSRISDVVRKSLSTDGTPSASVAIVIDDHLVYREAFGDASISPLVPVTRETRYQLASLSKTYVAQAVLLLASNGRLSLQDPVSRWYPDLTDAEHVTVHQLLNHTTGYPDFYPQGYPAGPRAHAATPGQIIERWGRHPLLFAPGTQFHYANIDYEIAGRIVEKVSGQPLFSFMQKNIFKPLGMHSVMDLDKIPEGSTTLATGYVQVALAPLQPAPYEGPGWSFGSGQVVTTSADVARWDVAFLQHRVLPGKEAAQEVAMARLADGSTYPIGLGLFVSHYGGRTMYYHTGEGLGFETVNLIFPDNHFAIVVLTNTNVQPTYMRIARQLQYLLLPPTKEDAIARKIFASLVSGHTDRSIFSADLNQYLDASVVTQYHTSLKQLGPIRSFELMHVEATDGMKTMDYNVMAGAQPLKLHLLFTRDGKLEDVSISGAQKFD